MQMSSEPRRNIESKGMINLKYRRSNIVRTSNIDWPHDILNMFFCVYCFIYLSVVLKIPDF